MIMIEKIRRRLIIKYTAIIFCILFFGFTASYTAYRHTVNKLMEDGLRDYLEEEVWEAREKVIRGMPGKELHMVKSDIRSLHNFSYWFVDKKIIRAERPYNEDIAKNLETRLLSQEFKPGKIYHVNIKSFHPQKQKWYFLLLKKDIKIGGGRKGEVFVLGNYTPVRRNTKAYIKIALPVALFVVVLAWLLSSFLAARSLKYIEQSYQKQKRFVSDAAHEFRTPLTILYSYAELLEYKPEKARIIADMKEEIQQMSSMVDRLLAIARYDNSNAAVYKENFCLNDMASAVVKSFSEAVPSGKIELKSNKADIKINADKVMIRQLLGILLDNAVKYTGKDKKITVTLEKKISSVKISVRDNGIGIKKEDLPHIFDRFWRAETSRHQKGLGLGLALAETIVDLHRGTIRAESEPGQGTEFIVVLP